MKKQYKISITRFSTPLHIFMALLILLIMLLAPAILSKQEEADNIVEPLGSSILNFDTQDSWAWNEECMECARTSPSACSHDNPECCVRWEDVCDDPPPPPAYSPPSVSGSVLCDWWGGGGWCRNNARITAAASDPQGFSVSISGSNPSFSCSGACTTNLPAGQGVASYTATTSTSGMSASGSTSWAYDPNPPSASIVISGTGGSNNWYISPVTVSASASDALSGVASANVSSGGSWSPSITLSDGSYTINLSAADVAGNITTSSQTIHVDTMAPSIFMSAAGSLNTTGWYTSSVELSANASDATSGVSGNVQVSLDGGSTWQAVPVTLGSGIYTATFRVSDAAGNTSTSQMTLRIDTEPPVVSLSEGGTLGDSGWYISSASVTAAMTDNLSGVSGIQHRVDGGEWEDGASITGIWDGIHSIEYAVTDAAGNIQTASRVLRVDTTPPLYSFSKSLNGAVLSDVARLAGPVSDVSSGVGAAEFSPDRTSWLPAFFSGAEWGFAWDTSDLKNGSRTLSLRARDVAGNIGDPVQIAVVLDNHAPFVSMTESWAIWESGVLTVQANVIPLQSVRVLLKDPLMRYPNQVLINSVPSSTTASTTVVWDRAMGNYVAAAGSYLVEAEVCDIYGLCSKVAGLITIPEGVPTPVVATRQVQQAAWVPQPPIVIPATATADVSPPAPEIIAPPIVESAPPPSQASDAPAWPVLTMGALVFMFAFLLMSDPRPVALRSLARTIKRFMKNQE